MTQSLLTKLNKAVLYYFIFYKNFYKFVLLHKPLCQRYKESSIEAFGLYICKSCLLLYFGFFLTLTLLIPVIDKIQIDRYFILGMCGCFLTLIISYPPIYSKFSRLTKNFIRFYDGIFLASVFIVAFKIHIITGFLSVAAFIVIRNIYNKKRSGSRICEGCEELNKNTTCSGYKLQKEALLKIEEEYSSIRMKETLKKGGIYD